MTLRDSNGGGRLGVDAILFDLRREASLLRRRGLEQSAKLLESVAGDVGERLQDWLTEPLTLERAAEESGYSYSTMQRLVAQGEIENRGERGSPLVRRCDIPFKPGQLAELWTLRDQPATGPSLPGDTIVGRILSA